jgi:hypothetical protein
MCDSVEKFLGRPTAGIGRIVCSEASSGRSPNPKSHVLFRRRLSWTSTVARFFCSCRVKRLVQREKGRESGPLAQAVIDAIRLAGRIVGPGGSD